MASAFDVEGSLIRVLLLYGANKNAVLSRSPSEISHNEDNDSCSSASSSVSDLSQPSHATTKSSMIIEAGGGGTHNSRFSSYALSSAASEEQICAQNAVFTPPSLPFQTGAHVKVCSASTYIAYSCPTKDPLFYLHRQLTVLFTLPPLWATKWE